MHIDLCCGSEGPSLATRAARLEAQDRRGKRYQVMGKFTEHRSAQYPKRDKSAALSSFAARIPKRKNRGSLCAAV